MCLLQLLTPGYNAASAEYTTAEYEYSSREIAGMYDFSAEDAEHTRSVYMRVRQPLYTYRTRGSHDRS